MLLTINVISFVFFNGHIQDFILFCMEALLGGKVATKGRIRLLLIQMMILVVLVLILIALYLPAAILINIFFFSHIVIKPFIRFILQHLNRLLIGL